MILFKKIPIRFLSETEKGTTHELLPIAHSGMILGFRKKGSVNGNHWHQGEVESKSPENFVLLSGKMKAYGKHRESGEEQEILLEAPVQVQIFPNVYHSFTALTDCQFIEFNSIEDHKKDTYYPQESVSLSS